MACLFDINAIIMIMPALFVVFAEHARRSLSCNEQHWRKRLDEEEPGLAFLARVMALRTLSFLVSLVLHQADIR